MTTKPNEPKQPKPADKPGKAQPNHDNQPNERRPSGVPDEGRDGGKSDPKRVDTTRPQ